MSCRVLNHGMENFVLNTITDFAKEKGFSGLKGEYIPTPKNDMVENLYLNLGFEKTGNYWEYPVNNGGGKLSFIKMK